MRQFADIALKGLSPGINDPTTALNAMEAMTAGLIAFAGGEHPSPVRLDGDGEPRFVADAPDLDQLAEIGFEQVLVFGREDPAVMRRLGQLLAALREAAPAEESLPRLERLLADAASE